VTGGQACERVRGRSPAHVGALEGGSARGGDRSWRPGSASMDAGARRSSGGGRALLAAARCVSQKDRHGRVKTEW
jgi:hypothetical protein